MFLSFRTQSAKKLCLRFAILSCSEKLWNVFEIVFEKCEAFVKKSLSLKKISRNLPTVKISGQSDKFRMIAESFKQIYEINLFFYRREKARIWLKCRFDKGNMWERVPPSYSKANLEITHTESLLAGYKVIFKFEQFIDFFINSQQHHFLKYMRCKGKHLHRIFVKFKDLLKWNKCWDQWMICLNCHVYW